MKTRPTLALVAAICLLLVGAQPHADDAPAQKGQARGKSKPAAQKAPFDPHRALILFDGTSLNHREGRIDALHVLNLLGHFDYRGVTEPIENYKAGEMAQYPVVFVLGGNEKTVWPEAVLRDARERRTTLVWSGYGINSMMSNGEDQRRGLRLEGVFEDTGFDRVSYKGTILDKGTETLARISVLQPSQVQVEATALNKAGREAPYVVRTGETWIFGDVPFAYVSDDDRYLVFCDLLHDILGVHHDSSRRALIRLEDVTPEDDADILRRAVDVFVSEGIPFQIGIVPIYRDPSTGREVYLSDRPAIVSALHDAVAQGGTIIMHGSSHQFRGTTPDDYEFWDVMTNRARPDDSAELVREKISAGLDECFRNDIYPISWETPHYAASPLDYREFARIFSTAYERPLIADEQGTQQIFPYPTIDQYGTLIIPEDLGYLPLSNPAPTELLANARAVTVVRDGIASAFVHDFIDAKYIRETVRGIKALGYNFVSLRDFPCKVTLDDHFIATRSAGGGSVTLQDKYLRQFLLASDGKHRDERWSNGRQTGTVKTSVSAGQGEIVVAAGFAALPPPPPTTGERMRGWLSSAVASVSQHSPLRRPVADPLKVALVWQKNAKGEAANDQGSFATVFRSYGIRSRFVNAADVKADSFARDEVVVVPSASATSLTAKQTAAIADFVRSGGSTVLDGRSALAEHLGVRYTGTTTTTMKIRDTAATEYPLLWRPPAKVEDCRLPADAAVFATAQVSSTILGGSFRSGAGTVLYLSALLDPYTADGTSRYPFLFEHVLDTFGRSLAARQPGVELYFDPGLRLGVSIEQLAANWRRLGVRAIYAAAWEQTANYTYDYDRLIKVCHDNGILVYAWFEFPQVSRRFWEQHPEWRELPAKGTAYPSWRLAMNLSNPACRAAALQFMTDLLERWRWDGVNLAELNFDGEANGDAPERVVPFNNEARAAFLTANGFDMSELFDRNARHYWRRDAAAWQAFLRFRVDMVTEWHRTFLAALHPFASRGGEVIVTMLDSTERPAVTSNIGIDSRAIVELARQFPFTLQVEDPAVAWSDPPSRYVRLAERYRKLLPAGTPFMIDINVVTDRSIEATHLPQASAVGTELLATVRAARTASHRVAIYGDSTARARDLEMIAYAGAEKATITAEGFTWSVDTPEAIELAVPADLHDFYMEGNDWPCWRPGFVVVPPGRHVVSAYRPWLRIFDLSALRPQLQHISAPLLAAGVRRGSLAFEYEDTRRVVARLGRQQVRVLVDDEEWHGIESTRDGGSWVTLPSGRHRVEAAGSGGGALLLDFVSIVSSSLIVGFGTMASVMLVGLYAWIRVRRLFVRRARQ